MLFELFVVVCLPQDFTSWANRCLSEGTVRIQINNLANELGDGLTLLDLAEVLSKCVKNRYMKSFV